MSFRSSTPFQTSFEDHSQSFSPGNDFIDQFLTFDDHQIDEPSHLTSFPTSPHLGKPLTLSPGLAHADLDAAYSSWQEPAVWSHPYPQSPPARGRSKTFSEHHALRASASVTLKRRPESEILSLDGIDIKSPSLYPIDRLPLTPSPHKSVNANNVAYATNSLRRKHKFNRSVSNFISEKQERSRERGDRGRRERSVEHRRSPSKSAIRKSSQNRTMRNSNLGAYANQSPEDWNKRLAQEAAKFDFGFDPVHPISPPPSTRVSDASSSENMRGIMRAKAAGQQQQAMKEAKRDGNAEYQWDQSTSQFVATGNNQMLHTPTTPTVHDLDVPQPAQSFSDNDANNQFEMPQTFDGSFAPNLSFAPEGQEWWQTDDNDEAKPAPTLQQEQASDTATFAGITSPGRVLNSRSLHLQLDADATNGWSISELDFSISPQALTTPLPATSRSHAHTKSLPTTANPMMLHTPSIRGSPTPTIYESGGEPDVLKNRQSREYFSHAAPPPLPAYIQSMNNSSPVMRGQSPMRNGKPAHLPIRHNRSPPSRSASPYSQRMRPGPHPGAGIGLGLDLGLNNSALDLGFRTTPPSNSNGYPTHQSLHIRKQRNRESCEHREGRDFSSHHQRGRSAHLIGASGSYHSSHSFPQPGSNQSPSPRQRSHHRIRNQHNRSKSSTNLRSSSSKNSLSSSPSKSKSKSGSNSQGGQIEFHNFTPMDKGRILSGVAPSGSSKTKARREKEAKERSRRLSEAARRAVERAGGDLSELGELEILAVGDEGILDDVADLGTKHVERGML